MKWIRPLGNMIIPAVVFYIAYHTIGLIPAVILSLGYSMVSVIHTLVKKKGIKNSQIIGILGLTGSAVAVILSGNEKTYYIPSVFQNILFLIFTITLSVRHKSILHYLAKDFEISSLRRIPEKNMMCVNMVWLFYFALKIIVKIAGILYLDFNKLYWVVFLQGDPMMILMIIISIGMIRRQYARINDSV
ncbi:MAG: DUF3159 domain-containing protein [Lachnospiraceae bacterium]|nr:DUF3159 domain-containing protein [Lachnospiraceae bacterium]